MRRPLIIWVVFTLLLILCFFLSGCRTGGKWIKSNSSGTTISPSNLEKGSDGVYRLKKAPSGQTVKPQESPQVVNKPQKTTNKVVSEKVPAKSIKSKPTVPKNSNIKPQYLPPAKAAEIPPLKFEMSSPMPINNPPKTKGQVENPITHVNVDKGEYPVKVDWLELFMFYFLCLTGIIFVWMVYDLTKDAIRNWKHKYPPKEVKTKPRRRKKKVKVKVGK